MKLELRGNDERYTVEQTMMALFPEEKPVYDPIAPGDDTWAVVTCGEAESRLTVTVEISCCGKAGTHTGGFSLSGSDYEREGQRRRAIGACFFLAARSATGKTPPWGSLTGVRPVKMVTRMLEEGKTPSEAERELEDTYFVSPERRRMAVESACAGLRARQALAPEDIAVYIGIPFCPTRCAYCSFVSASVERSLALVEPYLAALEGEIRAGGAMARALGLRVRAFYMGGGTPTTLTAGQLDRLLGVFQDSFDLTGCSEQTVESGRPDTVTPEKLAVLKRRGVTRLSINPQSMDDRVLAAIGRRHTAEDIRRAMGQAADAGFVHINMDLIAGLPEDTPESFRRSLQECVGFGTDNLTVHTLSLKRGSAILTEKRSIPGADAVAEMLDSAVSALRGADFAPYYLYRQKYMSGSFENVGWCRPGAENLYNIYIMEELCSILSLGAGGSTKLVDSAGRITRAFNLKYPQEYTARPEKWQSNQTAFAEIYQHRKGDPV